MKRDIMVLPKTFGDEQTDTRQKLEELGFVITDDTRVMSYSALAPDGWTITWQGRDGAVFNEKQEAVIWLWKKEEIWQQVFTMRLHP